MKKLFLTLFAGGLALCAGAQSIDIGIHGGVGSTWLINNNVSDQGDNLDPVVSFAPLGGLHFTYFASKKIGVGIELNYSTINQQYKGETGVYSFQARDRATYLDIPVLFKLKSNNFYLEVGPQVSILLGGTEKLLTSVNVPPNLDYDGRDIKDGFKKTVISGVLGLGGSYPVCHNLRMNVGIRLVYGFTDATEEFSASELYATGNNIGISDAYAHQDQKGNFSYQSTHTAAGYIMAGFTYCMPMSHKGAKVKASNDD